MVFTVNFNNYINMNVITCTYQFILVFDYGLSVLESVTISFDVKAWIILVL